MEGNHFKMAFYTFHARFNNGEWDNWTGNWDAEKTTVEELRKWYHRHWGPESKNIDRLLIGNRVVQFRLMQGGVGTGKTKTIVIFPEIRNIRKE
jgi:hypothetical protein